MILSGGHTPGRSPITAPRAWLLALLITLAAAAATAAAEPATPATPASGTPVPATPASGTPAAVTPGLGLASGQTTPAASDKDESFKIEIQSSPGLIYDGQTGLYHAHGQITITYQGGKATGEDLVYDPTRKFATLSQNVQMDWRGDRFRAEKIALNTQDRLWQLTNFAVVIPPSETQGQAVEPLYLNGAAVLNAPGDVINVLKGRVSSCDKPGREAHYWIDASSIMLIPGKKLVLRGASFVLLDHRLVRFPTMSFDLKQGARQNQFMPQVGVDQWEGYYVKERYPVSLGALGAGFLLLDLMSKKGFGKGLDDNYKLLNGTGTFHIYQLKEKDTGANDLNGSLTDTRRIGDWSTNLSTNYSANSYSQSLSYGVSQTTLNNNLSLSRSTAFSTTNINLSLATSNSNYSDSLSSTLNLKQHFNLTRTLNTDFSFSRQLNSYQTLGTGTTTAKPTPATGQNEYQFKITDTAPAGTFALVNDVHQPFGSNSFYFVERYPEFTLSTSLSRLMPGRKAISAVKPKVGATPTAPGTAPTTSTTPGTAPTTSTTPGTAPTTPTTPGTAPTTPTTPTTPGTAPTTSTTPGTAPTTPGATSTTPGTQMPPAEHGERGHGGAELPSQSLWDRYPLNINLTIGHYREQPANTRLNRADLEMDTSMQQSVSAGLTTNASGRFEQKMASDGSAQYVINLSGSVTKPLSRGADLNLNYDRIQPVGFTPFQFDRPGNSDIASFGADLGFGQQPNVVTSPKYAGALGGLSGIAGTSGSYGSYGSPLGGSSAYGGGGFGAYGGGFGSFGNSYGAARATQYTPAFHLGLHTAYDFQAARSPLTSAYKWSPLTIDVMAFPLRRVTFYANTTYDLNQNEAPGSRTGPLAPIRGGLRWVIGDSRFVDTSFTYDPNVKQLSTLNGHLLTPIGKLWTMEGLLTYQRGYGIGYNPYSGMTETILLTRDLHCFQANLFYSTNPHQINFSISIKAFPALQQMATQRFGQVLGQGPGQSF